MIWLAGRRPGHRLLRQHADRVGERGREAQSTPTESIGRPSLETQARADADQDHAEERDPRPDGEPARDALAEEQPRPERDEDRPDADDHRGRAGVERVLGEVEGDVVRAEPPDAVEHEPHPVAAGRPHPAALHEHQDAEGDDADEQPPQREGSAADLGSDTPDDDERARPGEDRERDRPQQQDALARGGRAEVRRWCWTAWCSLAHARPGRRHRESEKRTRHHAMPPQSAQTPASPARRAGAAPARSRSPVRRSKPAPGARRGRSAARAPRSGRCPSPRTLTPVDSSISSGSRPTSAHQVCSTPILWASVSGSANECQMSACSATILSVLRSPPPPIRIGMRRVGARVQLLPAGPDARQVLGEGVEPRSGRAELVAVLVVVALRPAGTGAEDEAAHPIPSTDVVDGAGHVGLQVGVAVAVAVDERAELDAGGLLGHGGEHRPRLVVPARRGRRRGGRSGPS